MDWWMMAWLLKNARRLVSVWQFAEVVGDLGNGSLLPFLFRQSLLQTNVVIEWSKRSGASRRKIVESTIPFFVER
jgi:hypothetical protein